MLATEQPIPREASSECKKSSWPSIVGPTTAWKAKEVYPTNTVQTTQRGKIQIEMFVPKDTEKIWA